MASKISNTSKSVISAVDDMKSYPNEDALRSFCIAFRPYDKILLFPPSRQIASLLYQAVEEHWTVNQENKEDNCYTLKLSGTPFLKHTGREHAILLKCLCSVVLERLKAYGWELILCTDMSCKTDLTAWYFRKYRITSPGSNDNTMNLKRPLPAIIAKTWSFVCLSLSKNRQVQLINAPGMLHHALKNSVLANYRLGIDKEIDHGGDYEIKLNGSPWDTKNRDQIVGALKTLLTIFRKFAANGFHLYGLVNLKETADSLFFEYDRSQTLANDHYMMVTLDDFNLFRLIGASMEIADVVESSLSRYWSEGFLAPKEMIDADTNDRGPAPPMRSMSNSALGAWCNDSTVSYEYKLEGSPWKADANRIGESRKLITLMLDTLLAHGWTAVTGVDVSRALNSKSALLFQSCPPVIGEDLKHACLSPLSKQCLQLINGPSSLRKLIKEEFEDIIISEKLNDNGSQYEITLDGFQWDHEPDSASEGYTFVRYRMGLLLEKLLDARWMVIASADVAHQEEAAGVGEGIHSWFLLYCGSADCMQSKLGMAVNNILKVGGRIGSGRVTN